jgi:hypothetical protein
VLARLKETELSGLVFQMAQFLRPLMSALPSLYLAMKMSKVAFEHRYGLLPSFFYHWTSFRLFGLIILGDRSSPMMTFLPLVNSA